MLFAIVDIETTGGSPADSGITEICAVITDGQKVIQVFETMINPGVPIPRYISSLTGITDAMIENAPTFATIASELYHLLHDKIFIAHNVNFDFGFLKSAFGALGYSFMPMKLCTVKLSRKAFPNRQRYSLGNICSSLGIEVKQRHRAGGDAIATAELFMRCAGVLGMEFILKSAKTSGRKTILPPQINEGLLTNIPETPGIYHFIGNKKERLYTGKAINLNKRIRQHFDTKRGKTALQLEQIHDIEWEECGNELMALLTEAEAIHKYWPKWNVAGKTVGPKYALVHYKTGNNMLKLQMEKRLKGSLNGIPFPRLSDARKMLTKLIKDFELCPVLIRMNGICYTPGCYCQYEDEAERTAEHNEKISNAIHSLKVMNEQILIQGSGRTVDETGLILIRNGAVSGWGFVDSSHQVSNPDELDMLIPRKPDLPETRDIITAFLRNATDGRNGAYRILKIH